ncbi:unnamed protein product [Spirodela intermedia]|uniref:4-coumarate--CoA ligase n=1 Tax=Spirodela intermedia TaxID=51605 RepID=A0A7I8IQ46_SPIIN|nr:unnamed protein product [Spirodela intermedia]CAA6660088.1 unnamed protein product [Spirodela intermedia]
MDGAGAALPLLRHRLRLLSIRGTDSARDEDLLQPAPAECSPAFIATSVRHILHICPPLFLSGGEVRGGDACRHQLLQGRCLDNLRGVFLSGAQPRMEPPVSSRLVQGRGGLRSLARPPRHPGSLLRAPFHRRRCIPLQPSVDCGGDLPPVRPHPSLHCICNLCRSSQAPRGVRIVLLDQDQFYCLLWNDNVGVPLPAPEILQSDPAAALLTSGTTGQVKAAVLSHGNFIALMAECGDLFDGALFHVFGLMMLLRVIVLGHTMVFLERLDFVSLLRAVERHRVKFMPVSPPLIVAMVKSDAVDKFDLSSLEVVGCGGAPLGKEVAERFTKRFPHIQIVQGYGLTESGGQAAVTDGAEETLVHGSVGRLGSNMEARIVDPVTGQSLPPGQRGELWLRGPTIMKGYLGDDGATASTLDSEGWLKTGDLCYFNEDGFLFIVDRLKELIKYKAYQVPPAELERVLLSHSEISDAAVVPYPSEEAGEIPMAYVVRRPGGTLSAEQVMEFVAKTVAPYKKVRRVAFIESIPKSAAGKILRRELITHALSGSASKL